MVNSETSKDRRRAKWEIPAIFAFGVVFLIVMLCIAMFFPEPTVFQGVTFGAAMALAAAGVAALIPGSLSVSAPIGVKAGGALAAFVIIFGAFWTIAQPKTPGAFQLPNGLETGWIFAGYVDRQTNAFKEGPYANVIVPSPSAGSRQHFELGDKIALNVSRELIIKDYKSGGSEGGDPLASPTSIPGGVLRDLDRTGAKLPKGSEWIVRDVVSDGYEGRPLALWIRIASIP